MLLLNLKASDQLSRAHERPQCSLSVGVLSLPTRTAGPVWLTSKQRQLSPSALPAPLQAKGLGPAPQMSPRTVHTLGTLGVTPLTLLTVSSALARP